MPQYKLSNGKKDLNCFASVLESKWTKLHPLRYLLLWIKYVHLWMWIKERRHISYSFCCCVKVLPHKQLGRMGSCCLILQDYSLSWEESQGNRSLKQLLIMFKWWNREGWKYATTQFPFFTDRNIWGLQPENSVIHSSQVFTLPLKKSRECPKVIPRSQSPRGF